jgi:gamma-glutamylcyclotransferase (GGCT)/AIG2-like uncharacterized protein YtfP
MTTNVFVYGTLKRGYWNNRLLQDSKFIGEATSVGSYYLASSGIPYAVPDNYAHDKDCYPIIGEVWEVDEGVLEDLDMLEGHPDWYKRELRDFTLDEYVELKAWIYEYPHDAHKDNHSAGITLVEGKPHYEWLK